MQKGRTIRKVMGGGGIFSLPEFYFWPISCARICFLATALCVNFFFLRKYLPYAQFAIKLIKNNATLF